MNVIVIATTDIEKANKISRTLNMEKVTFLTLNDLGITDSIKGTGLTLIKNVEKKAEEYYSLCKMAVITEESGLCIDCLNGLPGVFSKQIYEDNGGYEANKTILDNLKGEINRDASYITHYCYYDGYNKIFAQGKTIGTIAFDQDSHNGDGYDKIFISKELGVRLSELSNEKKSLLSHRAKGLNNLKKLLKIHFNNVESEYENKNSNVKFINHDFYSMENLDGSISIYQYREPLKLYHGDTPEAYFINVNTKEQLSVDFLGSTELQRIDCTEIELLGLSTGTYNCLKRCGINTKEEVEYLWTKRKLLSIKNFGQSKLTELIDKGICIKD